jgi:hypothetical protein
MESNNNAKQNSEQDEIHTLLTDAAKYIYERIVYREMSNFATSLGSNAVPYVERDGKAKRED